MREKFFGKASIAAFAAALLSFGAQALRADVVMTDKQQVQKKQIKLEKLKKQRGVLGGAPSGGGHAIANRLLAPGSISLIDLDGVRWFINSNITFTTSSSASGAMSEASYTHAVQATTLSGGTNSSTLNDAFDGYNSVAVSLTNALGPVGSVNPNYIVYLKNGPAAVDPDSSGREYVFNSRSFGPGGSLQMWRKVYIPSNDSFARWLNFVQNNGSGPVNVNLITCNNLGSDANTVISNTSDGDTTAELADNWVSTYQAYGGNVSPDPRLAHIMRGPGTVPVPLANIVFANGDDNPYWAYTMTLQPGETYCIMNFCAAKPSRAEAEAKANELIALPANALQYMSTDEIAQVKNFLPPAVQYTVNISATAGGTTNPSGSSLVDAGGSLTATATADSGFQFIGWSGDVTGLTNPVTFTVNGPMTVQANFAPIQYTVSISSTAGGTTNPNGSFLVNAGGSVTATATANSGFQFTGWSGDVTGLTNPVTFTVNGPMTIQANFEPSQYLVSISSTAGGTTDPRGDFQVTAGSSVTATAVPDPGYRFTGWTGDLNSLSNPATFTVNGAMAILANFLNAPPVVAITAPSAGALVYGTVNIAATASDDGGVVRVEFYVDGVLQVSDSSSPYGFSWDTFSAPPGDHTLKAVAYDAAGATASHQITVRVANVTLILSGVRVSEKAWAVSRDYGKLSLTVNNPGAVSLEKYVLYRKTAGGAYAIIKELSPSEVGAGSTYLDKYLTKNVNVSYKLTAVYGGVEIAVSNEISI